MLHVLRSRLTLFPSTNVRSFAQASVTEFSSATHPYFVPRNSRGSLPVYTDVRNGGSRYLVLIRNVDGSANALAKDLSDSLFEQNSSEACRMKIKIVRSKHLVIQGGHWKNNVVEWLRERGF